VLRILYLVPCFPAGKTFGTTLRVRQIGSALRMLGTVDTIVVTAQDDEDLAPNGDDLLPVRRVVRLDEVGRRSGIERLRCGFDPTFIGHHGRTASDADRLQMSREIGGYDLVWICQLRTADAFGRWQWPRSVLDVDDVPSEVLKSQSRNGESIGERFKASLRVPIARLRERALDERFTTVCVCSDADAANLASGRVLHVVPNGFPAPAHEPQRCPADPPRLGFVGTCDYAPNADGIRWFVRECWPEIAARHPTVRLRVVGRGTDDPQLIPADARIDTLGWFGDVETEMATWTATIVPIRTGGGTRVKIAEAFSRKCPIVSTSFGAHGYDPVDGREMRLTDSPAAFVNACLEVMDNPADAAAMAERGWRAFLERWSWDALQPRVYGAVDACLSAQRDLERRRTAV